MKQIKKILFKNTKKSLLSILVCLVLAFASVLLIGFAPNEDLEILGIILSILAGYGVLIGLIFLIISFARYRKAISYFSKRIAREGIELDEEQDFEKLSKNLYLSSKIVISTFVASTFVFYKSWVTECSETEKLQGGRYWPCILIKTDDKQFTFFFNKEKFRVETMEGLKVAFLNNNVTMNTPIMSSERINQGATVDINDKSNGMNIIVFGAICLTLVAMFGLSYPFVKDMIQTKNNNAPVVNNSNDVTNNPTEKPTQGGTSTILDLFDEVDGYVEQDEVNAIYNILEDTTYIYITNSSPYAFKGTLRIFFGDEFEDLETYWIRSQGYDYLALETKGEPTEYKVSVENYLDLRNATDINYVMYETLLVDNYGYDVVLDGAELNEENVLKISLDEAVLTDLEEYSNATLIFHDMKAEDLKTTNPPEDYSTARYIVEIDTTANTYTLYKADGKDREEVGTYNY